MGESAVSNNEAGEMEEHLRGLGYIDYSDPRGR
jgi:hypothetical protein